MSRHRLAIIGAGSSGLVTLKHAQDRLPDWDIVCFEKGGDTIGCWGNPYPGFISTSTKFTTQFACHRKWGCLADPASRAESGDFFRGDEYGRYLKDFVASFDLAKHIRLHAPVKRITRECQGWKLWLQDGVEFFDRVIICSGLAERAKKVEAPLPQLRSLDELPEGKSIVVMGGGESAADIAHRLAAPELNNQVHLSLKTGIRVSPRYHPIRGVPSDFLRNRLMLSIHQGLRNAIGQKFVEARIRHREKFEKVFKSAPRAKPSNASSEAKRKEWDARLTAAAKDHLFNVFHTKSDGFLDDVAAGRISIIGPPKDGEFRRFSEFDGEGVVEIEADLLCPMIGYTSGLEELTDGELRMRDFHLGCMHVRHEDVYLVGFARPIIGNVPTISEMQAKWVTSLIAGVAKRPEDLEDRHRLERENVEQEFPQLNTDAMLPVEMFPYCDALARMLNSLPTPRKVGLRRWWKIMRAPASTLHYVDEDFDAQAVDSQKVHSPPVITLLLLLIRLADFPYRFLLKLRGTPSAS
ncbi:MAG: NAD(P)-binding domain-containing protein [Haloferula sp.]